MRGLPKNEMKLSDFLQKTTPLSQALHYILDVGCHDVAALYLPNILEFYPIVFGVWLCGAIVSITDPELSLSVLAIQLKDTKPKVIFCTDDNKEKIEQAILMAKLMNKPVLVVLDPKDNCQNLMTLEKLFQEGCTLPSLPSYINDSFHPENVIVILWSSGNISVLEIFDENKAQINMTFLKIYIFKSFFSMQEQLGSQKEYK